MDTLGENLARAMVLGEIKALSEHSYFVFSTTGLAHMLCASGFQLYLLQQWLLVSLKTLQNIISIFLPRYTFLIFSPFWRPCLCAVFLFFFSQDLGFTKPITRALFAALLSIAGEFSARKIHPLVSLFASALFAFFCGRGSLLSFSLSFFSVAALSLYPYSYWAQKNRITKTLFFLLAPWLATLPIIIFCFHQTSIISIFTNLFLSPWIIGGIIYPGFFAYCLEKIASPLSSSIWKIAAWQAELLEKILSYIHHEFFTAVWVDPWQWLAVLFLLSPFFWRAHEKSKKSFFYFATCILFACFFYLKTPVFSAAILNVGQGDAIYLQNPTQNGFLIDFGKRNRPPYPAKASSALAGISSPVLAGALLTHPDADHASGLESILERYSFEKGGALWISKGQVIFPSLLPILRLAERAQIPIRILPEEKLISPYAGLLCYDIPLKKLSTNNSSPLCKFHFPNAKAILFTGDMDQKKESLYVAWNPIFLRSNYLKLGHHGSKSSSSEQFLDSIQAKVAIVSAGKNNSYQHPHPSVLKKLYERKTKVLRTDTTTENVYLR